MPEQVGNPAGPGTGPDQDLGDVESAVSASFELQVVDLARHLSISVDDFAIEKLQVDVERAPSGLSLISLPMSRA